MSKKLTIEEYKNRIREVWGNEYSVVSDAFDSRTKMKFVHNKCGWIIESNPYAFSRKNSKCPICDSNSKNMTTSALKRKILIKSGSDYELLDEYKSMVSPIRIKHNNCCCEEGFHIFTTTPKNFLDHTGLCPKERHKGTRLSIDTIRERLSNFHNEYELLTTEYNDPNMSLSIKCDKGHVYEVKVDGISAGNGCPICNNKITLRGYNDYCTTHPQESKYLNNYTDGFTFSYGTNKLIKFKCVNCGQIVEKKPSDAFNEQGNFVCICNDGFSYPEKYVYSVLSQLNVDFIYQLTRTNKEWCGNYRYDFYIPKLNLIIEVHGMQHYKNSEWSSLEKVQKNDLLKEKLARANGCNYIIIDARYSNSEFIKNNIINSEISSIYDLSNVDWVKCNTNANNSLYIKVINMWSKNMSVKEICQELNLSSTTVLRYLEDVGRSGLCDFDRELYRKTVNHGSKRVSIKCLENNITYSSFAEVHKKLGIFLSKKKIINNNYIGGFHWEFA